MNNTNTHNERIAKMTFASVYPLYLAKVEKKGRTKEELHQVIQWLTGFTKSQRISYHWDNLRVSRRRNREPLDAAGSIFG